MSMSEQTPTGASHTDPTAPTEPTGVNLARRHLLRGGAVLAGAAGVSVLGAALGSPAAEAADNDPILLGAENTATSATTVTSTPGEDPVLTLVNPLGPTLRLAPVAVEWEPSLAAGDLVGTASGPLVGVDYGDGGTEVDYLVTGNDIDTMIPVPLAEQRRLLSTKDAKTRTSIVRSSSSALDGSGRLKANAWIDVAVVAADEGFDYSAAFVNVSVIDPTKNGYLTVYSPGTRPGVSTINFRTGVNLSNAAFVGLREIVEDALVIRIHTSQTTHVLVDLSGLVSSVSALVAQPQNAGLKLRRARQAKRAALVKKRLQRADR